jgi:hypothetical protein
MDFGNNPMYGKPGAPQGQTTLLIITLLVVCSLLYWMGAFNGVHPTIPQFSQSSNSNATPSQLIASQFGQYTPDAMKIANCESSMNPRAVNTQAVDGSYATGLFQILYPSTWKTTSYAGQDPKNAQANTAAAWEIFKRDGYNWHEWECAKIVGVQ